jgi:hypothetical protein
MRMRIAQAVLASKILIGDICALQRLLVKALTVLASRTPIIEAYALQLLRGRVPIVLQFRTLIVVICVLLKYVNSANLLLKQFNN